MNAAAPATRAIPAPPRIRVSAAQAGLALSAVLVIVGWLSPLGHYLTPRSGLGYALGIVGGSLMLALLIYPARKRLPSLSLLGSNKAWFRIHMVFGVAGPICILYHCCYHLGATNSNVALVSMLVVASSGLVGRYLYGRIHHGLYGQKASLTELRGEAERLKGEGGGAGRLLPEFAARLDRAEQRIATGIPLVPKALSAALLFRIGRASVRHYVHRTLRGAAADSLAVAEHRRALSLAADRYADARLTAARRVAEFQSCERLFGLWHVLHLPLFGMLFVAGIVHVIAVNVY
ncbi:MAG TPA: hypothetical protein VMU00_13735 [Steroidobacteraceae bacterium]|nr:hypothetical protein [Steroidobacteraceae bacterium]